jgi:CheY-like chemotaxis protein
LILLFVFGILEMGLWLMKASKPHFGGKFVVAGKWSLLYRQGVTFGLQNTWGGQDSCPAFIEENAMSEDSPSSVLLVDDDPSIRAGLSIRLKKAGFEAREAEDGIDGLMKLRNELPKVIISDLEMPRMSGLEFVSVVRRRFPFIPVIVLSGPIPDEVPVGTKPDVWFEKDELNFSELLRVLHDLVRKTPDRADLPQVVTVASRTGPGFAGYYVLTCTDCLRTFRTTNAPENKTVGRTAICTHCGAPVSFLIESSVLE